MSKKRLHLMVTERQQKKLRELADKTGYSISELLRRAIDLYLSKTEKKDD